MGGALDIGVSGSLTLPVPLPLERTEEGALESTGCPSPAGHIDPSLLASG